MRLSRVLGARMPAYTREDTQDSNGNHEERSDKGDALKEHGVVSGAAWSLRQCTARRLGSAVPRGQQPFMVFPRMLKIVEMLATRPKTLKFILVAMLDPLTTAEIQALSLELHHFGGQHHDPAVQFRCLAVT